MRRTLAMVLGFTTLIAATATAQEIWPTRTIRLVVGFAAGGPTDIPARMVADKLSDRLGKRIVVENKAAAGGMLATRDVLSQDADGYNLLLCTHFDSINVAVYRNPGFKLDDLAPISVISKYYYALAMSPSVPANTFEEFVAYAKANPGKISYATIGSGSAQEIMAKQLEKAVGIQMNKVPFRLGTQVVTDMIAGRVEIYFAPTLAVVPYHAQKQLKILAVSSPERLAVAPDVPALKEMGLEFVRFGFLGLCAKKGTPQAIIDRLHKETVEIVKQPDYQSLIEKGGSIPASSSPEELRQIITKTYDDVAVTIREFGMQQD